MTKLARVNNFIHRYVPPMHIGPFWIALKDLVPNTTKDDTIPEETLKSALKTALSHGQTRLYKRDPAIQTRRDGDIID